MNISKTESSQPLVFDFNDAEGVIIVACSGGPDSICLLHYLKKQLQYSEILCAHYDHRWSPSSINAVKVVERLCQELSISLVIGKADSKGKTSEAKAREQRYKFLSKLAKDYSAKAILTAHHLDDQIETFFLRILRGTGPSGLECIKQTREFEHGTKLIRPLLKNSKADILSYCQTHNLFFYEDPSNKELDIKRNQIRSQLIPLIKRIQPSYSKQILNLIEMISNQNDCIENLLDELPEEAFESHKHFLKQATAIQSLIIKRLLEKYQISYDFETIEDLREGIISGQSLKISVDKNYFFESNGTKFNITKTPSDESGFFVKPQLFTIDEYKDQKIEIPGIGQIIIRAEKTSIKDLTKDNGSYIVHVDLSKIGIKNRFVFRGRQPKDKFQQLNAISSSKLRSFLINRKVRQKHGDDLMDKLLLLSLEDSSEILWIPGVEISDRIKVDEHSTHCFEFIPLKNEKIKKGKSKKNETQCANSA